MTAIRQTTSEDSHSQIEVGQRDEQTNRQIVKLYVGHKNVLTN